MTDMTEYIFKHKQLREHYNEYCNEVKSISLIDYLVNELNYSPDEAKTIAETNLKLFG